MSLSTKAAHAARLLLGLVFFVFGLNGFFGFLPQPPLPEAAGTLMGAFAGVGYFFPVLKGTEVVAGALLLSNRFVPLALVLLAPVVVQIALFHFFLTPGQMALSVVLVALEVFLAWSYRDVFRSVLGARHAPTEGEAKAPVKRHAHA
ncbi:MAG: DoxX family protein [Sandaracinus sp.]|nr:DoxX family protein [Sandaracinus sp.]